MLPVLLGESFIKGGHGSSWSVVHIDVTMRLPDGTTGGKGGETGCDVGGKAQRKR